MISVIVPVYNAEKYLIECLTSIQKQSYGDFEVICVNDGSTDNSSGICQQYVDSDNRFSLINQDNKGVSSARNTGLELAKGDYICFIDADDIIDIDYLEKLFSLSKQGTLPLCSYTRSIKSLGLPETKLKEYIKDDYINGIINEIIEHPGLWLMLFCSSIIKKHHLTFFEGCIRNEDYEFFLKYLMYVDNVIVSNYRGYYYRVNTESVMHVTTMKSLTSLDASKRIGALLYENNYTLNINIDLYPSIQSLLYHLGRENNKVIYDYIHSEYDIKGIMKELLCYKAVRRKLLSALYLISGRHLFFDFLSSGLAKWMPL